MQELLPAGLRQESNCEENRRFEEEEVSLTFDDEVFTVLTVMVELFELAKVDHEFLSLVSCKHTVVTT